MNIRQILNEGIQGLKQNNVDECSLKAKSVLMYVLNCSKEYLLIHENEEIGNIKIEEFRKYIKDLISGKPLQYITKAQKFMGLDFYVDENVLIPQPDTEILVEEAINIAKSKKDLKVLDLCTGSGAIGISIAKYTNAEMYASDISKNALEVASKNAKKNNVDIKYIYSDMFKSINDAFDIIVSNPPYIETKVINTLEKEVQAEPHLALDGGEDGLYFYKIIAQEADKYLKQDGYMLLEIGYNQKEKVIQLLEVTNKYTDIVCLQDLSGNNRVIKMRKKG